jgi:hypothetical protein
MNYKNTFNKKDAYDILDSFLKKYPKLKIVKWSATSCGYAYYNGNIKIPKPNNVDRLFVCLHEIKHVIDGKIRPSCLGEFYCDKFGLDYILNLGWKTDVIEARMKWHILSRVAMATNRKMKKIPAEISDYYPEIDMDSWIGKKTFVGIKRNGKRNEVGFWECDIKHY